MNTHDDELNELIYGEACRLTGMCCLMLASNGEEVSRSQLAYQLKSILRAFTEETVDTHPALILAIEQLQGETDEDAEDPADR